MWTQEELVAQLHSRGKRITRQRMVLLELILKTEWDSGKELYYEAKNRNLRVGMATVYRMLNTLEEIGVVDRRSYRLSGKS